MSEEYTDLQGYSSSGVEHKPLPQTKKETDSFQLSVNHLSTNNSTYAGTDFKSTLMFLQIVPSILRKEENLKYNVINPVIANMFIGDFYGLLTHLGVPAELMTVTLLINRLNNPVEYNGDFTRIRLVDEQIGKQYFSLISDHLNTRKTAELYKKENKADFYARKEFHKLTN